MKAILNIKKWFKSQLIKNKIIIIYTPLIIIPICIIVFLTNSIYSNSAIEKTKKSIEDNSKLIIKHMEIVLNNTESAANMLFVNINIGYRQLEDEPIGNVKDLKLRNELNTQLSFVLNMFPDIESAAFIDVNGNIYDTDNRLEKNQELIFKSPFIKMFNKSEPLFQWYPIQKRNYLILDENMPVVTFVKRILETDTQDTLGILILNIKESTLSSIYKNVGPLKKGDFFIADRIGTVVSTNPLNDDIKKVSNSDLLIPVLEGKNLTNVVNIKGKEMLVTSYPIKTMGLFLVSVNDMNDIVAENRKLTMYILFVGLMCLLLAVLGANFLSRLIINPILKLKNDMLKINTGNLDIYCNVDSDDEIGLLAAGFNKMIEKIKELLNGIKLEQKKKREYELALIQAQTKPHFLYNTLDLIYVLCSMGRGEEAKETTKSLADFYRITLSNGKEIVTIEEEIKNVRSYLIIQRKRYSEVFDFSIQVDNSILNYKIPKLTIQPLVENSIYHGLKPKNEFGRIHIEGYILDGVIKIKVVDDGLGIKNDKLAKILNRNDETEINGKSFGLRSVDERIKLYYGHEYGINIESTPAKGTEVTFTIPATEEENYV